MGRGMDQGMGQGGFGMNGGGYGDFGGQGDRGFDQGFSPRGPGPQGRGGGFGQDVRELTLKAPIPTKVVCFSPLLKC